MSSMRRHIPGVVQLPAIGVVLVAIVLGIVLGLRHSPAGVHRSSLMNFAITTQAETGSSPTLSTAQADAAGRQLLADDPNNPFTNYVLASAAFEPGLTQVADPSGVLWFQANPPENDYVLVYTAPAQGGYKYIASMIVVDADTGKESEYQLRYSNTQSAVLPAPPSTPCAACAN